MHPGTPILALTGTAGKKLTKKIKKLLCMSTDTKEILVSPDRKNIMYHVEQVKKGEEMDKLMWLVNVAKRNGLSTPKTIIFCNTYNEIAAVFVYLLRMLQDDVYVLGQPKIPANRIVGIFHSMTLKKYKDRVMDSFKVNAGNVRIVLASSALGMGVNFPDVRYVVHLGPARSIVDHVQQSGRAGRDGKQAYNFVITTGQKLAHCETDVKNFAKTNDCFRKALLKPLDLPVDSVNPLHNCCSNCKKMCTCNGNDCSSEELPFTQCNINSQEKSTRLVTEEDKTVLEEALKEFQSFLNTDHMTLVGCTHGFTDELIKDIVINASSIFSLDDILSTHPIFSTAHARFVLGIFQDIFGDTSVFAADDDDIFCTVDSLLCHTQSVVDIDHDSVEHQYNSDGDSDPEFSLLM